MSVKKVVLGKDADGVSRILINGTADRIVSWQPGIDNMALAWVESTSSPIHFNGEDLSATATQLFPPVGGAAFHILHFPAQKAENLGPETYGDALADAGLEMNSASEDGPWHATSTVDFGVVVEGAVDLKMRNGDVVTLRAGDTFVQRGGEHAWAPHPDQDVKLAVVLVGHPA